MRNPERIDTFLSNIGKLWREKFPDWRFGQLMYNFFCALGDPFYYEEDEFLEAFKAYCNRENPKEAVKKYRKQKEEMGKSETEIVAKYREDVKKFFESFDVAAFQEELKREMEEIDKNEQTATADDLK